MPKFMNFPIFLPAAAMIFAAALNLRATEPVKNSLGMKLIPVPSGEFVMGSDSEAANWDEMPLHRVTISKPFLMAETEVTAEQFHKFKPDAPLNTDYAPYAAAVSWADAVAFCEWLSEKEGRHYRLPTEAEWEYACRAGRSDGSEWETAPDVKNPWGLKNLLNGPVEWTLDWYGEYDDSDAQDPVGYADGFVKVVRGGYLDTADKGYLPEAYQRPSNRAGAPPTFGPYINDEPNPEGFGMHRIGFRVVAAEPLATTPRPRIPPFVQQGVKLTRARVTRGPDPSRPYLRRRPLLPIPPEDTEQDAINHAGLHPSFRDHNHSPGLEVLPNGDALLVIYTSYHEYEPEVSLIAARLRFGAESWDMPSPFIDTPGANDHAPLLWHDGADTLWLFWGHTYAEGHFPFNYMTSHDNGATWSPVTFPQITGPLGEFLERPQPINTVVRAPGPQNTTTLYVPVDAAGGGRLGAQSMLWATSDNGYTWFDTLGRTFGRHTTFVLRRDGSILGLGGKNTGVDDFMPSAISRDGGRTYELGKTPFSQLNSGQRPSVLRLDSGRLFMAGDYQPSKNTEKPASIKESGAYVALSDDDGETWHIKRLPGAYSAKRDIPSLGYSAARQAPNGIIHLITSLNHPALHFEMNEAWILSDTVYSEDDVRLVKSSANTITDIRTYSENYPDGRQRVVWSSGVANDGRVLLHGTEKWFYPNGAIKRVCNYRLGVKTGIETYWGPTGLKIWEWHHRNDGVSDWTTWWPDGSKRSESSWENHKLIPGTDKFYKRADKN